MAEACVTDICAFVCVSTGFNLTSKTVMKTAALSVATFDFQLVSRLYEFIAG